MHMLDRVDYVADDVRLDRISWIRYTYPDGKTVVFRSDGKSSNDPAPQGIVRRLDCIDCHNLAGHDFNSPNKAVNHALSIGRLDVQLPYIKREAVRALSENYASKPQALSGIAQTLENFYQTSYPELWKNSRDRVANNVTAVQEIYKTNFFPEYKVDWRTYPNHVGHMESEGCFRCHDGLHVADDGRKIGFSCETCHTFLYRQDEPDLIREQRFDHMAKINDYWGEKAGPHSRLLCSDCHDGAMGTIGYQNPSLGYACGDCHASGHWLEIKKTLNEREAAAHRAPSAAPH
jgi:formate-dependent nitrite reductase cytochrome c552 subunit